MKIKNIIRLAVVLAIVALSGGQLFASPKPEDEAQKAADQWLALIDAGKYAEGWSAAASFLKAAVPQAAFVSAVEPIRSAFGEVASRKLKSAKVATSLPGAPDGQYVVIQVDTSFANKKTAVETITPMLEKDGTWKVSGYFIK